MTMTDPIADMLTRIRNAIMAKHTSVDIPKSQVKMHIAKILKDEGYIKDVTATQDDKEGLLRLEFKFINQDETKYVIRGLKRISKPGRRRYVKAADVPQADG